MPSLSFELLLLLLLLLLMLLLLLLPTTTLALLLVLRGGEVSTRAALRAIKSDEVFGVRWFRYDPLPFCGCFIDSDRLPGIEGEESDNIDDHDDDGVEAVLVTAAATPVGTPKDEAPGIPFDPAMARRAKKRKDVLRRLCCRRWWSCRVVMVVFR